MSVIIRLQGLPWSANALDIRRFFHTLAIPDGGVHIIGGEKGDAFIAFSTDEDARQAMMRDNHCINDLPVKLFLSSKTEMQNVIAVARGGLPSSGSPPRRQPSPPRKEMVPPMSQRGPFSPQNMGPPQQAQHFNQMPNQALPPSGGMMNPMDNMDMRDAPMPQQQQQMNFQGGPPQDMWRGQPQDVQGGQFRQDQFRGSVPMQGQPSNMPSGPGMMPPNQQGRPDMYMQGEPNRFRDGQGPPPFQQDDRHSGAPRNDFMQGGVSSNMDPGRPNQFQGPQQNMFTGNNMETPFPQGGGGMQPRRDFDAGQDMRSRGQPIDNNGPFEQRQDVNRHRDGGNFNNQPSDSRGGGFNQASQPRDVGFNASSGPQDRNFNQSSGPRDGRFNQTVEPQERRDYHNANQRQGPQEAWYIEMKNMPNDADPKMVRDFLSSPSIPRNNIKCMTGRHMGNTYVKLSGEYHFKEAMRCAGRNIGNRHIDVFPSNASIFNEMSLFLERDTAQKGSQVRPRSRSRSPIANHNCVEIRNLPTKAERHDVKDMFRGMGFVERTLFVRFDDRGICLGNGFVAFDNDEDARRAVQMSGKKQVLGNFIELLPVSQRVMDDVIFRHKNRFKKGTEERVPEVTFPPIRGPIRVENRPDNRPPRNEMMDQQRNERQPRSEMHQLRVDHSMFTCVRMKGLAYESSERIVEKFFANIKIVTNGIHLVYDATGRVMGTGFVEFVNADECRESLKRNMNFMLDRWITLKSVTKKDMFDELHELMEKHGNHRPPRARSAEQQRDRSGEKGMQVAPSRGNRDMASDRGMHRDSGPSNNSSREMQQSGRTLGSDRVAQSNKDMGPPNRGIMSDRANVNPRDQRSINRGSNERGGGGDRRDNNMGKPMKVEMRNLPFKVNVADVLRFLQEYNPVNNSLVMKNRGEAVVSFHTHADTQRALRELYGKELMGRPIKLFPCNE